MKKRIGAILLTILLVMILIAGCSSTKQSESSGETIATNNTETSTMEEVKDGITTRKISHKTDHTTSKINHTINKTHKETTKHINHHIKDHHPTNHKLLNSHMQPPPPTKTKHSGPLFKAKRNYKTHLLPASPASPLHYKLFLHEWIHHQTPLLNPQSKASFPLNLNPILRGA